MSSGVAHLFPTLDVSRWDHMLNPIVTLRFQNSKLCCNLKARSLAAANKMSAWAAKILSGYEPREDHPKIFPPLCSNDFVSSPASRTALFVVDHDRLDTLQIQRLWPYFSIAPIGAQLLSAAPLPRYPDQPTNMHKESSYRYGVRRASETCGKPSATRYMCFWQDSPRRKCGSWRFEGLMATCYLIH